MQYFVVMIDYGRRGREAIVDPEITRREVISRIASGEYANISFIHEIADRSVEDVTEDILAEAALPEIADVRRRTSGGVFRPRSAICASTRRCERRPRHITPTAAPSFSTGACPASSIEALRGKSCTSSAPRIIAAAIR